MREELERKGHIYIYGIGPPILNCRSIIDRLFLDWAEQIQICASSLPNETKEDRQEIEYEVDAFSI